MRIFIIRPGAQEQDVHVPWVLFAIEANGTETEVGTFPSMADAEAAKLTLERQDIDIRS